MLRLCIVHVRMVRVCMLTCEFLRYAFCMRARLDVCVLWFAATPQRSFQLNVPRQLSSFVRIQANAIELKM